MRFFTTFCLLLTIPFFALSQKGEIGGFVGLASYQGDLVYAPFSFNGSGLVTEVFYKHYLTSKWSLRATVGGGLYSGDDNNFDEARDRNFSFNSNFIEVLGAVEYSFISRNRFDENGIFKKSVRPFINIGIGFLNANPDVSAPGRIPLDPADENPPTSHFTIPLGIGLQYDLSERLAISGELTHRTTFTDYLDGFSVSANPDANDWLIMGGFSLSYKLGINAQDKFNLK